MNDVEGSGASGKRGADKKKWVRWTALGCAGLVVLAALLGGGLFLVVKKATAGPEQVVKGFLADAGQGNYTAAYDRFSAPLKQVQPFAEFQATAAANPTFFRVKETTFNQRSVNLSGAELSGTVTLESGTEVPASFKLVKENGSWKLISYHIGS